MTRSVKGTVLVTVMNPPLLTLSLNRLNFGVFVMLKKSTRNWPSAVSPTGNFLNMLRSRFATLGVSRMFRPDVPNRCSVTGANADGS